MVKSKIEKETLVPADLFEKAQTSVLALFRTNFFNSFLQSKILKAHLAGKVPPHPGDVAEHAQI